MDLYAVMDVGGTFLKYAVMTDGYEEVFEDSTPTPQGKNEFFDAIVDCIALCIKKYPSCKGIALSMAGFIDPVSGENSDYSVSEKFRFVNYKKELNRIFGLPVSVENDSNCASLAEIAVGAGKGCLDVCVMTIGTGIGGAIIHNGKLFRGKNFKAGEFGFSYVAKKTGDGEREYVHASATAGLAKRVRAARGIEISGKTVYDHFDDPVIKGIYDEWVDDIAVLCGNIASMFDPEKLLIGGGISKNETFMRDLTSRIDSIFPELKDYTKVEPCLTGNTAGKIGALMVFKEENEHHPE